VLEMVWERAVRYYSNEKPLPARSSAVIPQNVFACAAGEKTPGSLPRPVLRSTNLPDQWLRRWMGGPSEVEYSYRQ